MNGKDFIAKEIKSQLEQNGNKVLITHFADLLKYICKSFFDWNGKKDNEGRALLQYVGTDIIRENNPNYWVNFLIEILDMFKNEWDYVLIPDCRFPNEVDIFKEKDFNVTSLKITRPNFKNNLTDEQNNHPSEISMDNYTFDYELTNDNNYRNEVAKFLEEVING